MWRSAFKLVWVFLLTLIAEACVDRLFFEVENQDETQLVIDGLITDEPGPYQIKLFRSSSIDVNLGASQFFSAKEVSIADNLGNIEILKEVEPGIYETEASGIRGVVGRSYTLRIVERDGNVIESSVEALTSVGEVDSVYFKFESFLPISGPTEYGFRVFMDSKNDEKESKYLRWRFRGTYVSTSYPRFRHLPNCHTKVPFIPPSPPPCSGYIWNGEYVENVGQCTCCDCWVTDYENEPKLNDDQLSTSGIYKGVEVGFVPYNQWTFAYNKYMVVVEQLSLSRKVYDYWKTIRDQKDGATSLFQPAYGKIQTNLQSTSPTRKVVGFFYASSIKKKAIFITGDDAPFSRPDFDIDPPLNCTLWDKCTIIFANASTTPPPDWQ